MSTSGKPATGHGMRRPYQRTENMQIGKGWHCSHCGCLERSDVSLYRPGMLNAHSKLLDPHCRTCGDSAEFRRGTESNVTGHSYQCNQALIISSTCSSGKSTISYLLSEHHGFIQVDGDWILQRIRKERGCKVHSDEIHRDLVSWVEDLLHLGRPVVLAHVIPPAFLSVYEEVLAAQGVDYRIVILMPEVSTLLSRNATRKCWPKTTPEFWVMKFYDEFLSAPDDIKAYFYDNSRETEMETASSLSRMIDPS